MHRAPLTLIACSDAEAFAREIASHLNADITPSRDVWFACGEGKHVIDANLRGRDVYVIQRPVVHGSDQSIYDRLIMALHACDAARCADAQRVVLLLPYFPGGRQDKRKNHAREGVSTGLFARLIEASGVDMLLTLQPHNEATIGCFNPRLCVFEGLTMNPIFAHFLEQRGLARDVVGSTDVGGLELARDFARLLRSDLVALSKERDYSRPNTVAETTLIGDVQGRSVLVIDDIVDTAGSMVSAVRSLWDHGATDITLAGLHLLLSGPAWSRLKALKDEANQRGVALELVGTSAIQPPVQVDWVHSCPVEPYLAKVISRVNDRRSVRALES